jgi:hypothetical protein
VAENVLGTIFGRADALKRQLYDMIRNPSDYASMVGGRTQENLATAQALQNQAFGDPQNPLRITNPQALNQLTQMITSGPLGFAPAGITKGAKWSLPTEYDDVTKLPIPKEFGGVKTEDYLFHGGIKGKLDIASQRRDLQGAPETSGIVPTSFSKSPQEALEYTTISSGDMVAIPKSSLNIYQGGNKKLDDSIVNGNTQPLKDAGYDGVDLQTIRPGGYREVVVWGLDKVADKALYAPVGFSQGEIAITQPLKSLLD